MKLTGPTRERLVGVLSSRLSSWGQRQEVAARLGLADVQLSGSASQAWRLVVRECEERDIVLRLLQVAASASGDLTLRLAAWSAGRGRMILVPRYTFHAVGLAVIALLLVAGALVFGRGSTTQTAEAPPAPPASETTADAVEAPSAEPVAAIETSPPIATEGTDAPGTGAATGERDSADAPPTVARDEGPCPGNGRVGYAYAGGVEPTSAGGVWTVAKGVYVRADRPRAENGWSSKKKVLCTLERGDRVRLVEPVEFVEGGAWWVPIHGGAVLRK